MKIGFVIWTLCCMGGSERVVYDIARKLKEKNHSIFIISFQDGPARKLYENLDIEVCALPKKGGIDLFTIAQLRTYLKEREIEIVNPHHYMPLLYSFLATRFSKTGLVYTEHSRWQLEQLKGIHALLNRFMLTQTDGLVAISQDIYEYYLHILKIRRDRVHLITNGIDLSLFQKHREPFLREAFGIKQEERVVGVVANIRPEKNHKLLLKALSILKDSIENVRAVFVGLDCMAGEIQDYAENLGLADIALFLGERDDVHNLLPLFDVFCLPSLHEGLPLSLLEAMAAGVPVIASNVLGINTIIDHGINGLLFRSGDEQDLAQELSKLLNNERMKELLSCAGRLYTEHNHSLDKKIELYDDLFSSLLRKKSNLITYDTGMKL